jgi:5-hydroxyisourate hydrolase-like protein (transthyretin family)
VIRLLTIIIVILTVCLLPAPAFAQETANGTVTGQVINDTTGSSVSGAQVTLITYIDNALADFTYTNTDNEGNFIFENIDMENTYLISVKYEEADYYYQVFFENDETTAFVSAGVCDVTTDDADIRIGKAHNIIEVEEDSLSVTMVFWLYNDGERTLTGTDGVLFFTLPEDAYNLEAPEELMIDYLLLDSGKLTHLVPFPPGERQIVFSYQIAKPDTRDFTVPFTIDYPADSVEVMVLGEDIEVAVADLLAPADPVYSETGERFIHFEGTSINRGAVIEVIITNLNTVSSFPLFAWIVVGVGAAGAIIYVASKLLRRKTNER